LLLILGLTVATLGAVAGAAAMIVTAGCWAVIGIQGMRR
jgi:hypothetical protein